MPSVRTDSQPMRAPHKVATATAAGTTTHHGQLRLISRRAAGAQDRDQVTRDAGDRHLRERDHAAVAAEERERERDHAERERLRGDLEREERGGEERIGHDQHQHEHVSRATGAATGSAARRGHRHRHRARASAAASRARRARARSSRAARAGVHRLAPVRRAHASPRARQFIALAPRDATGERIAHGLSTLTPASRGCRAGGTRARRRG